MNDELKVACFQFIVPRSPFRVFFDFARFSSLFLTSEELSFFMEAPE
jgi:hypothetical protein